MNYTIHLEGMEFHAFHGCYDLEQKVGNRFIVELTITTHLGSVAAEDAVEKAVNYLSVYEVVREQMAVTQRTIERVAMNIIEAVKAAGLDGIEWGGDVHVPHGDVETAKRVAKLMEEAGLEIIEARITYLAYAPEIAAVMLQRQQASAIIDARKMIVDGAVGMVEMALERLNQGDLVNLDEERKAAMVSNLLVVLCGNHDAQPIVNTGSLY